MKRTLTLILTLTLLLACLAPAGLAAEQVTINFWGGWTGPDADTMKGIVDKYMGEHPNVTINFETQQWTPLFTKFLADASTGNAPHILAMRPMDMGQFIEMGLMDDAFATTIGIDAANYSPAAWDGTMYKGKQYAIPLDQHMHGLYYNEDMLKAAGIDNPPATGEELIDAARRLTIDKNGKNSTEDGFDKDNIVQYGYSFNMNHHVGFQMSAMIAQQGGTPFTNEMSEVPFDGGQAARALSFLQDLVIKYGVCPIGDKTPVASFTAGSVAMFVDGPWQMPALEATDLNWKSARYPKVFDEQIAWGNEHIFAFPLSERSDAQSQAVRDFILWMDQNSGEWAKSGQIPASTSGQAIAAALPGRQAFIDSMANMYLLPASAKSAELFGSSATSPFVVAAQSLLLDGNDPAAVAEQLEADMNAILSMP
ncbi:extracellular solute-binding protein [Bacillota bacterium Meth-B3]